MGECFSGALLSFPSYKRTTQVVVISWADRVTVKEFNEELQPGFKAKWSTATGDGCSCNVRITYDPSAPGATLQPGQSKQLVFRGIRKLHGKEEEMAFKIVVKVEVVPDKRELSDAFRCSVCLSLFSDLDELRKPVSLSLCGHTFCKQCIDKAVAPKYNPDEDWVADVTCTTCDLISLINPEAPPYNWNLIKLMGERRVMKGMMDPDRDAKDPILPCYENPNHEATVYCEKCEESFCKRCFEKVHDLKIMAGHTPVSVDQKPIEVPKCPNHPDEAAVAVCRQAGCDEHRILCKKCCIHHTDHRLIDIHSKLQAGLSKMTECLQKLEKREAKEERTAKAANENWEAWRSVSKSQRERIAEHFDKLKDDALTKYDEKTLKLNRQHDEINRDMDVWRGSMGLVKSFVQRSVKRKADLLDTDLNVERTELMLNKRFCWGELACPPEEFEFTPDMSFEPRAPSHYSQIEPEQTERKVGVQENRHVEPEVEEKKGLKPDRPHSWWEWFSKPFQFFKH